MLLILISFSCGEDPILKKAQELEAQSQATSPANTPGRPQIPGGKGSPDQHKPGVPEEPTPGLPTEPPPGGTPGQPSPGSATEPSPGIPGEVQPVPSKPEAAAGPKVEVSGMVVFEGWKSGEVRITAFDGDHQNHNSRPRIIGETKLASPGPFSLQVPEAAGKVYIEAAVDEDMDGRPGPQDPQGKADRSPVTVESSPVSGLTVTLTRREPPPGSNTQDDF